MTNLVAAVCESCCATRKVEKSRPVYHFVCPKCSGGTMVRTDADEREVHV